MKIKTFLLLCFINFHINAQPRFIPEELGPSSHYVIDGDKLCATAQQTLAYLNKGYEYDPRVIHEGKIYKIPLTRIKATLVYICQHPKELSDPHFLKKHFDFVRWYPDMKQVKKYSNQKSLLAHLPADKILMTKYYIHRAPGSLKPTATYRYPLHALPTDEKLLTREQADLKSDLIRLRFGKQAILKGALATHSVPVLAYLQRDDLEAALLQGTLLVDFNPRSTSSKIYNVHRCNNIAYNKVRSPYQQERYWYFKEVSGIKGYGKDADYKITVNEGVTFAADLEQFGLGKLLIVQYPDEHAHKISRIGIFADTGGAFQNNLYQVDFLTGTYRGKSAFTQATQHLPDYVNAYFMVLKNK